MSPADFLSLHATHVPFSILWCNTKAIINMPSLDLECPTLRLWESFRTALYSGAGFWLHVTFCWCIPVLMFSFEGYQSYFVNSYIFQPGHSSLNYIYKCPFSKWGHRHMCRVFLQCTTGLSWWALVPWAGRVCEGSTFKLCTWGVTAHGGHSWKS